MRRYVELHSLSGLAVFAVCIWNGALFVTSRSCVSGWLPVFFALVNNITGYPLLSRVPRGSKTFLDHKPFFIQAYVYEIPLFWMLLRFSTWLGKYMEPLDRVCSIVAASASLYCFSYSIRAFFSWGPEMAAVHKRMVAANFGGVLVTNLVWLPFYGQWVARGSQWWTRLCERNPAASSGLIWCCLNAMLASHFISFVTTLGLRKVLSWNQCSAFSTGVMGLAVGVPFVLEDIAPLIALFSELGLGLMGVSELM